MLGEVLPKYRLVFQHRVILSNFKNRELCSHRSQARAIKCFSTKSISENDDIPVENIRNFCIIAHVDHGKSTLADRLLEITGVISQNSKNKQVLDRLPVEKERGITVKAVAASLQYSYNNKNYLLNLIDTPGHVDFSNEVSRSLFACQGAILLIDANQGVQAQTVAYFYSAFTMELEIIPVLNKIDLPNADPESVEKELHNLFAFEKSSIHRISAKTGVGVEDLIKIIIEKIPPPQVSRDPPFKALLIDSWFDKYRGALLFLYIVGGDVRVGDEIASLKDGKKYNVKSTAKLTPNETPVSCLRAGQVGLIGCNMRSIKDAHIGDTIHAANVAVEPLRSFEVAIPKVFAGLYPRNANEHEDLKIALEKLCLNDSSVTVKQESSPALGLGWRLGFLGLLHLDVFRQRLEQEFEVEAILTAPSTTFKVKVKGESNIKYYGGEVFDAINPTMFPDSYVIEETLEPIVLATIITPVKYFQKVVDECLSRRGLQESTVPLDSNRIMIKFTIPFNEIMLDFHDKLKSITSGYASFDYESKGYVSAPLKKLKVLVNKKEVEELTSIVHADHLQETAQKMVTKLHELIPRQNVEIPIQAVCDGNVLARRTIKAYRKNVAAKLYGGDLTRKMKLYKNQKEGKEKMRKFANVEIHRDTFIDVLKRE